MKRLAAILLFALAACGGPGPDEAEKTRIGFKVHELECPMMGCNGQLQQGCLLARLGVSGIAGECRTPDLIVTPDRRVTGACAGVTTGEIRDFRLVYYQLIGQEEVDLATVVARLDLRGETNDTVRIDFPAERIATDFDDDADGRINIAEFCAGTNPRVFD